MLTNAIVFKGKWTLQFDPKSTHSRTISNLRMAPVLQSPNDEELCPIRVLCRREGLEAIRLPYADRTFAMYLVLPQDSSAMQIVFSAS